MKRRIFIFGLVILFFVVGGLISWPAIRKSPMNVVKIIEEEMVEPLETNTPGQSQNETEFPLILPKYFKIAIAVKDINNARVIEFGPSGEMLVSSPKDGKVYAFKDGKKTTVVENLNSPHGIVADNDKLYIAETEQVGFYDYNKNDFRGENKRTIIALPGGGNHFSRTIIKNGDKLLS